MRKLIVATMVSLDGVMQAPGGPEEDPNDGFAHGGWVWPYEDGTDVMGGAFKRPFELVLGRRTYDIFAAYWPHVAEGAPHRYIADLFNGTTKHVATHRPETLEWQNSHALGSDVYPVLLGRGKHLFDDHAQAAAFRLEASQTTSTGVLVTHYVRVGEVRTSAPPANTAHT